MIIIIHDEDTQNYFGLVVMEISDILNVNFLTFADADVLADL